MPSAGATARSVTSWRWPTSPRPDDSAKPDPRDGLLPLFLVEHEGKEERFYSEKERHDYFAAHNLHVDVEAELESGSGSATAPLPPAAGAAAPPPSSTNGHRVREIELHEVKMLNKHLVRLRDEFDLRAEVLLPREVTGDDPPPRFILDRDGEPHPFLTCEHWSRRYARSVKKG